MIDRLRQYEPGDILRMTFRDCDDYAMPIVPETFEAFVDASIETWTLADREDVVAIFGAHLVDGKTARAFFVAAPRVKHYVRELYVAIVDLVPREMTVRNITRLEAIAPFEHDFARRFLVKLGFQDEGNALRWFDDGSHGRRYVRFVDSKPLRKTRGVFKS